MFQKLLIANRGEIAVRIIRACREMGIKTVAVYSQADADALHTQLADESICIGKAEAKDSYLNMERILSATIASGADAIHPGFGFLSENSKFAALCEKCNITFIGPSARTIEETGNKSEARNAMVRAGVPVIPGTKEPIFTAEAGRKFADEIGYPVMIKAALGGGGKGMRVVQNSTDFENNEWASLRKSMGHEEPFNLTMVGIGNEQWEAYGYRWYERYEIFEKEIHKRYPDIKLIGTSGPTVETASYRDSWKWIREKQAKNDKFTYAVDEHYYMSPEWFLENDDFYDDYDRSAKVFAGEYAAHTTRTTDPVKRNNLEKRTCGSSIFNRR